MPNVFCPLCGVVLEPVANVQPGQTLDRDLVWIQEIRAVRSLQGTSSPFLTGLGFLNDRQELVAHPEAAIQYTNSIEGWQTHPLRYSSGEFWVFPLHDACWSLLLDCVTDRGARRCPDVAHQLFYILYCAPCDNNAIWMPAHDYGGAGQFQRPWGNVIRSIESSPHWLHLLSDPKVSLEMKTTACSTGSFSHEIFTADSKLGPPCSNDPFLLLPEEVIIMILVCLPSVDVCNLRLSSKHVAAISKPTRLPQSFWASRFKTECEMGFIAFTRQSPSGRHRHPDWRQLYFAARSALQNTNGNLGLRNRKRIWDASRHISAALTCLSVNGPILGDQVSQNDLSQLSMESVMTYQPRNGCKISGEVLPESMATEELRVGCRNLESRSLTWPRLPTSGNVTIGVSFVWINSRSYVSGLRLWNSDNVHGGLDCEAVGLVIPSTEKKLLLHNQDQLQGVEVAVVPSGIVGLRFLVQGPKGHSSHAIGNFNVNLPDIGIGKLISQSEMRFIVITVGLDVCKFVSMQLTRCAPPGTNVSSSQNAGTGLSDYKSRLHNFTHGKNQIWNPKCPSHISSLAFIPKTPIEQTFNLHLNMDFGGLAGCRLQSLQRIVAVMLGYPTVFLGLDFIYDNGSHSFYGRRTAADDKYVARKCIELSFPIHGAHGEMVSEIEVGYCSNGQGVQSIQIRTNKGISTLFRVHGYETAERRNKPQEHSTLKPPEGEVITGFLAIPRVSDGSFQTFGIQSQAADYRELPVTRHCTPLNSNTLSVTPESPDTGCDVIYRWGTAFTTASLSDVRCIRISHGETTRSRTPGHISGLWLQYYNSGRSAIVGQWITELDSWELSVDERLTEIWIWSANESVNSSYGKAKLGRVTGISFTTSYGRSKQILKEDTPGHVCIKFRANLFEELGGVIWAFNTAWDHVRILYRRTAEKDGLSLHPLVYTPTRWIVPEKLFWQDRDRNGTYSTVSSIQVNWTLRDITGISFTYRSGVTRTLGSKEGETSFPMHISASEHLTRIDVGIHYDNKIRLITFYTDQGRQASFHVPASPPKPWQEETEIVRRTAPDEIFSLHPCTKVTAADAKTRIYEFPSGADGFVGLWAVIGRTDKRFSLFGPIFMEPRRDAGECSENGDDVSADLYSSFPVNTTP